MATELIAIIALAGLMIGLFCCLRQEIRDSNNCIDKLSNEIKEQGHILGEIRERLSRLEGLIEACALGSSATRNSALSCSPGK